MPFMRKLSARIRSSAYPKTSAFPPIRLQGKNVLDVGCGREPLAAEGAKTVAVDGFAIPGSEALERIQFVRGMMESLPFANGSFDFVSSRNALYYSHMPTALREIRRVLKPDGMVWGTLAATREAATRLVSSLLGLRFGDVAYVSYGFLNGLLTTFSGKQVRWINPKRCESVNTRLTIRRLLRDARFEDVSAEYHDRKIIFSARKPS